MVRKKIPYVQQLELSDCGAAALAIVLKFNGKDVRLDEVRTATGTGRDGVDALAIVRAARGFGMRARGVSIDVDSLGLLERGSILHWEFNHFVVFEDVTRRGVRIVDPAMGRRHVSLEHFNRSFTGVALLFETAEDFRQQRASSKSRWRYLGPLFRRSGLLGRVGATSLLVQVLALVSPVLTGVLIDRVIPENNLNLLSILAVGLGAMVGFYFFTSFLRGHLLLHLRTHLDLRITLGFIEHLVELPYSFFLQRSSGDLMMRLNSNATVREILTSATLSAALDGSFVTVYLLLMFAQSAPMALLILGLGLVQVLILVFARRRNRRLMAESLEAQARSQGYLVQILAGMETLKTAGAEQSAVENWSNLFINEINVSLARGRLNALIDSSMAMLRIGSPVAILILGGIQVLNRELSLGVMMAMSALAVGFLGPLAALVGSGLQLQLLGSYMERINDVLDAPREQDLGVQAAPRLGGRIRVEGVSFSYGPGAPRAVEEVSIDIAPGQSVALVGQSGSGKSTLANLLLGLYTPQQGRILYDGLDLATLEIRSVRRQLGMVPQHPYLFGSSIRDNIALVDSTVPLDKVVVAARLARIHDDVSVMPMGYDTVLADGGATLSGGQRQRLALARALVRDPVILLLDEATSSLDSETESRVYRNLEGLACTRIIIAHRLGTVVRADQILVMDAGRIVERGTHSELIALKGRYSELVASQSPGGVDPAVGE